MVGRERIRIMRALTGLSTVFRLAPRGELLGGAPDAGTGLNTNREALAGVGEVREIGRRDQSAAPAPGRAAKRRAVAQLGRALRSGRRGRGFKSHQPDGFAGSGGRGTTSSRISGICVLALSAEASSFSE